MFTIPLPEASSRMMSESSSAGSPNSRSPPSFSSTISERWIAPTEVGDEDAFDYTMNPWQALEYARENEARAMNFYRTVSENSTDAEIKAMAMEFATEEADHTAALDKMIAQTQRP